MHYKLPLVGLQLNSKEGAVLKVVIDVENLKENESNWGKAQIYLDKFKHTIDIAIVVKDYYVLIDSFHKWLNIRQFEIHGFKSVENHK